MIIVIIISNAGCLKNERLLWKTEIGTYSVSKPILNNDKIILSNIGSLYSIDKKNGTIIWKSYLGGDYATPLLWNNKIYIGKLGFKDDNFFAFDAESGKLFWKFETGSSVGSTALIHNGVVYFGCCDNYFYALDANSGKLRWKYNAGDWPSSPVVYKERIYFGTSTPNAINPYFYSLDAATGELIWKKNIPGHVCTELLLLDDIIYFGLDYNVCAIDAETGNIKWIYKADGQVRAKPSISDGIIYIKYYGKICALNLENGRELWAFKSKFPGWYGTPLENNGVLYFGDGLEDDGAFYALDAKTGQERWNFPAGGVQSTPLIHDNIAYFTDNKYLYAIKTDMLINKAMKKIYKAGEKLYVLPFYGAMIRKEPNFNSAVLSYLPHAAEVKVADRNQSGLWLMVTVNNMTGYMQAESLANFKIINYQTLQNSSYRLIGYKNLFPEAKMLFRDLTQNKNYTVQTLTVEDAQVRSGLYITQLLYFKELGKLRFSGSRDVIDISDTLHVSVKMPDDPQGKIIITIFRKEMNQEEEIIIQRVERGVEIASVIK